MKVSFISFGCKVNQAEVDDLINELHKYDAEFELDPAKADIAIINTCAVTEKAQNDGEKFIAKLKLSNPTLKIAATGCLAELMKDKLNVDYIVSNANKMDILSKLLSQDDSVHKDAISNKHTRSFLKIQDGCNCHCTYCIIPSLRGTPSSIHPDEVVDKIKSLLNGGFKEIVLTGIHIGIYGHDLQDQYTLNELLRRIIQINGDFRVRLSSLYIDEVDIELINVIKSSNGKICPHFHLSLQSGSDTILKAMGRKYSAQNFVDLVKLIRLNIPDANIGIDLITGFPGETAELYSETVGMLKSLSKDYMIDYMHVFPYSKRPGTPAAKMENQIPIHDRKLRAQQIRLIAGEQMEARKHMMSGKYVRILAEKDNKGHTDNFYLVLLTKGTVPNTFVTGTISIIDGKLTIA